MKLLLVLLATTLSTQAHAEAVGKQWYCQEEYDCKEKGTGQILYPVKLGAGKTKGAARASMRLSPGYNCERGSLRKIKALECKIGVIDSD